MRCANAQTKAIAREPAQTQTVYRTIVRERVRPAQPTIGPYKSMVVNDRVVPVDPVTGEVVAELTD